MHFSLGRTSEAEDWGRQHAAVCREEPLGPLSEHHWTGAAGSTATDTDAAGGWEATDQTYPDRISTSHTFPHYGMLCLIKASQKTSWKLSRGNAGDTSCHRICFLSCFTPLLKSEWAERPGVHHVPLKDKAKHVLWRAAHTFYSEADWSLTWQINPIVWTLYVFMVSKFFFFHLLPNHTASS